MTDSTAVQVPGLVDRELTVRGTTSAVTLDVDVNGFTPDPDGGTRAWFSASAEINRHGIGVSFDGPIPCSDNAMVLSDKVALTLEVEAVLRVGESAA